MMNIAAMMNTATANMAIASGFASTAATMYSYHGGMF